MSESKLAKKILEFMYTDVTYSMKRVLAADKQQMYIGPGAGTALAYFIVKK